jgi:chromosome partitioning protein
MENTRTSINSNIKLGGIFATFVDDRITLHKNAKSTLQEMYGEKFLKTSIRNNVRIAEAPGQEMDIFALDPKSNGAKDYYDLSLELLGIN